MAASLHNVLRVIAFIKKESTTMFTPAPRFSHIDASDSIDVYAVDTNGRAYLILWLDHDIDERDARVVAMPIQERFWKDNDSLFPVAYLDAWTGDAE